MKQQFGFFIKFFREAEMYTSAPAFEWPIIATNVILIIIYN